MADNFQVLDAAGSTVTFRSTDVAGVEVSMSIPTGVGGTALIGQAVMTASIPVVLASNQSVITAVVSGTVTSVISGTPSVSLTAVGGVTFGLGQAVMATSLPVAIASNQTNVPVNVASGTLTAIISGTPAFSIAQISGTAISIGQAVMTASFPVVIASNQSSLTAVVSGTVTAVVNNPITAVVSGTVTSVISGTPLVNLTAVGGVAFALGQAVMATSLPVAIASNQSPVPVSGSLSIAAALASTGTQSNITSTTTAVTLLAANTARLGATIFNDSTQTVYVLLSGGGTVSTALYSLQVGPNGYYEVPFAYDNRIAGVWVTANGTARVMEFST